MFNKLRAAAYALLLIAIAACGEAPNDPAPPSALPTATPFGIETPSPGSIYLGAYVPNGGIVEVEQYIGRTLALDSHYYGWVALFPGLQEAADISNGRLAIDSWNCGTTDAQIVSGSADMLIQTRALALKSLGRPVFLRFMWDPNQPATALGRTVCVDPKTDGTSGTFSASEYVAAYIHIHNIFEREGATNVIWIWSYAAAGSNPTAYYPGSAYVDWIGVDVYNGKALSFSALMQPAYAFATSFGKPVMISETGAVPNAQPDYFGSMMPALQQQFPRVQGLVYYDGSNYSTDWALGFTGLSALSTLGGNSYLSAFGNF